MGERVNESTFTTKLNISRTTFREAMRQLEQAGLPGFILTKKGSGYLIE